MQDSETFLDVRIRKYRYLLDQQSIRLSSRHLMEGNDHIIVVPSSSPATSAAAAAAGQGTSLAICESSIDASMMGTSSNDLNDINSSNEHDNNVKIDIEKQYKIQNQFHQQEINEQKLKSILQVQKNILTEIEVMRRKLIELQSKRDEIVNIRNECEDFLIASAEVDMMQQQQHIQHMQQNNDDQDMFISQMDNVSLLLEMTNIKSIENQNQQQRQSHPVEEII